MRTVGLTAGWNRGLLGIWVFLLGMGLWPFPWVLGGELNGKAATPSETPPPAPAPPPGMVTLELTLPKPAFIGTPKNVPPGTRLNKNEPLRRPPFFVPPNLKNVAAGKPVKSSDNDPIVGELKQLTDGDKENTSGRYVELGPGLQWIQIDLGAPHELFALVLWHFHGDPRVYHDVVVQISEDEDFIMDVKTLFNNDHDNSAGQGVGEDFGYFETFEGKLVNANGARARFIRLYSNGSTADQMNRYTELEVYGRPAP